MAALQYPAQTAQRIAHAPALSLSRIAGSTMSGPRSPSAILTLVEGLTRIERRDKRKSSDHLLSVLCSPGLDRIKGMSIQNPGFFNCCFT
jgi:hypothetical protein